jgi:protein-arginine kinase
MADGEGGEAPPPAAEEGAAPAAEGEAPAAEAPPAEEAAADAAGEAETTEAQAPAAEEGGGGEAAPEAAEGEAPAAAEAPAEGGEGGDGSAEAPAAEEAAPAPPAAEGEAAAEGGSAPEEEAPPPGFNLPKIDEAFDAWLKGQLEASPADAKDTDDFKYITFTEVPPFTDGHKSLMRQTLTPELFEALKEVKSSKGYTLSNGIQAGVLRPHLGVGFTCGDEECFELFKDLIYPIVKGWHGFDPATQEHKSDLDASKLTFTEEQAAKFGQYVKSTRVRAARNIAGFSLPAGASSEDRLAVEGVLKEAFASLPEPLQGTYYPLGDLTAEQENELQAGGFLFQKPGPMQLLGAAGAGRNWPEGRGIFHNESKTVLCWCNEEDQCRIIAMEDGGDVKGVFERFCSLSGAIKGAAENNGKALMESPNLGFLGTCPSNLGTGLRASVMIVLPQLNKDPKKLEEICAGFDLQPRGSSGEHSAAVGAKWDISNKQRIGFSEVELVQKMIDGVSKLIAMEEELAAAAPPPEAAAAADATAGDAAAQEAAAAPDAAAAGAAEGGEGEDAAPAEVAIVKTFNYNAENMRAKRTNMDGVLAPGMIENEFSFGEDGPGS